MFETWFLENRQVTNQTAVHSRLARRVDKASYSSSLALSSLVRGFAAAAPVIIRACSSPTGRIGDRSARPKLLASHRLIPHQIVVATAIVINKEAMSILLRGVLAVMMAS
ncbi:hypothetical protein [Kushneria phyllosphaerae]|uniref:hypothetical protein n=1 Tax=Kushneria phyllosphaerae TaxID=2100822 RepID=UPI001057AAD8|nr:hypothetical protein [Kushneria phyllosphaerae]